MDPEQTYLRVHARVSGMLSQLLTPRIRLALEYIYLAVAVALLLLLVVMHTNFVQQPGCSKELSGIDFTEAQLIQIKISGTGLWTQDADYQNTGNCQKAGISAEASNIPNGKGEGFTMLTSKFWLHWIGSGARRSRLIFKSWKSDKEFIEPKKETTFDKSISKTATDESVSKQEMKDPHIPVSSKQSLRATVILLYKRWQLRLSSFWKNADQFIRNANRLWNTVGWGVFLDFSKSLMKIRMEHLGSHIVQWLGKRSKAFEPTYLYTLEKGFFLLPEAEKSRHGIKTVNITLSAQNSCFGNRWQQLLINSFGGYDTILMNSLLNFPGKGYLYNFQTKEFYRLSYGHEPSGGFGDYFVTKCGVLIMSLFVFFTTTMSVSFTLRETQARMLKFTVQLQHHARHQLPTFQLIFVHVIESLVFVPIMIGILFFLFEFYDDQLLAFLVLTLVWLCELFTMISVRTSISMQFFPRFFLLYFLVFHIYFFSYPYGFSYLAFSATSAFMQHLILYFWNRFEVPALQRFMRNRGQLPQQAGVQITSSTIYTSTLHIARVDVQDPGLVHSEAGSALQFLARPNGESQGDLSGTNTSSLNNSPRFQDLNRQPGTATGHASLNPFASLLLWVLGGASSDSIVSFFSMFRDQGPPYEEPQGQEVQQRREEPQRHEHEQSQ